MPEVRWSDLVKFSPKQQQATEAADTHSYTLYGGAAGGGKSYWLRWYPIRWLIRNYNTTHVSGVVAGLFCEDYPALKDRHLTKMTTEFPEWLGQLKESSVYGLCFMLNPAFGGGVLALRNLDDPSKYLSSEFALEAVDELTRNTKDRFDFLRSRLRWPGIDKPRFIAGTNPGGVGHCVPQGEVLTPRGWVGIQHVVVGDLVMSQDDQGVVDYWPVEQVIAEKFEGNLIESHSNAARFVCTPHHKIARVTETKNRKGRVFHVISLVEAEQLSSVTRLPQLGTWKGREVQEFVVPPVYSRKLKQEQPTKISGDQYCELMGWFLSEGHTVNRDKAFGISQLKPSNRLKIADLLIRCGFMFNESKSGFLVYSAPWYEYFRQFGKCREKFVPDIIKAAVPRQLRIFWDAAMAGDGCENHYYTTSLRLADDMQEVGLKMGLRTYCSSRQRKNRVGLSYDISFKENKIGWVEKNNLVEKPFSGMVYCLGIPQIHRFFLRQNGTVWLSGNSWVKNIWLDRNFPATEQQAEEFVYVRALAVDNPHIAKSYLDSLASLPEKQRKAYLEGDWDIFEGQVFTEFRPQVHVCEPFDIPDSWVKLRSIDPSGRAGITSCHWYAVDHDGRVWVYREHYGSGLDADEHAQRIAKLSEGETYRYTVMDSAAWSKLGLPESIAEVYERNGVDGLVPASKNRLHGWDSVHRYLRLREDGKPGLVFFSKCGNMIRTLPALVHDEHNPEDVDSTGEDHAADELRYLCQSLRDQAVPRAETYMERKFRLMREATDNKPYDYSYSRE